MKCASDLEIDFISSFAYRDLHISIRIGRFPDQRSHIRFNGITIDDTAPCTASRCHVTGRSPIAQVSAERDSAILESWFSMAMTFGGMTIQICVWS